MMNPMKYCIKHDITYESECAACYDERWREKNEGDEPEGSC